METPTPPIALGDDGLRLWNGVRAQYEFRPDELELLLAACRTLDEVARLEEALATADVLVTGSRGQVRSNPLVSEVRAHRLALRALLSTLGIPDLEEGADPMARSDAGRQLAAQRWGRRTG